jgi:hypothetical protein
MSPTYLRVKWIHDFEDEPDLLYYELDEERYAARSIEIFKDGRSVRASEEDPKRNPRRFPINPHRLSKAQILAESSVHARSPRESSRRRGARHLVTDSRDADKLCPLLRIQQYRAR